MLGAGASSLRICLQLLSEETRVRSIAAEKRTRKTVSRAGQGLWPSREDLLPGMLQDNCAHRELMSFVAENIIQQPVVGSVSRREDKGSRWRWRQATPACPAQRGRRAEHFGALRHVPRSSALLAPYARAARSKAVLLAGLLV